jgi:hypothetical protein
MWSRMNDAASNYSFIVVHKELYYYKQSERQSQSGLHLRMIFSSYLTVRKKRFLIVDDLYSLGILKIQCQFPRRIVSGWKNEWPMVQKGVRTWLIVLILHVNLRLGCDYFHPKYTFRLCEVSHWRALLKLKPLFIQCIFVSCWNASQYGMNFKSSLKWAVSNIHNLAWIKLSSWLRIDWTITSCDENFDEITPRWLVSVRSYFLKGLKFRLIRVTSNRSKRTKLKRVILYVDVNHFQSTSD